MSADPLHRRLREVAAESGVAALGVAVFDWEARTGWGFHADRWFHAASTMKLPVLLGVYEAVAMGRFAVDSRVHVRNLFRDAVDGSPYRIDRSRDSAGDVHDAVGRTLRVDELARHMIVRSSNLATNVLIDLVGLEEIQETLARYRVRGVEVVRGVEDLAAWERGINNRVTAEGLLEILRLLRDPARLDPGMAEAMLEILHGQEFRTGIPAGLPDDARVAHKTGEISTAAHDAGLVFLPDREPYAVVILTGWEPGATPRKEVIARVSEVVYGQLVASGEAP